MIAWREGSRRRVRIASVAVVAAGALAVAGCGGDDVSGGSPEDGVASYVPAGSPMYFEVTTELESPQWQTVRALGAQFPAYPELLAELRDELADEGLDFDRDLRPLMGERAAVALTRVDGSAVMLDGDGAPEDTARAARDGSNFLGVVDIAEGARPDVEALLTRDGGTADGEHEGASLFASPGAPSDTTAIAVTDDVLLIADTRVEVIAALDVAAAGGEASLASAPQFTDTLGKLPQDVFGKAYLDLGQLATAGGQAIGDAVPPGLLTDLDDGTVGAAMIAEPDGVRVKGVVSGVETISRFTSFSPSLVDQVPADAILFGEVADISSIIRGEVDALRAEADPAITEQVDAFAATVPEFLGVTIDDIAALGEGRQALAVLPGPGFPGVVFMSQVADGARATATLDAVRMSTPSLLAAIGGFTGGGQPGLTADLEWSPVTLPGGVRGWGLELEDGIGLIYAVRDDMVLMGSSVPALAAILDPQEPLSADPGFQQSTAGIPESVTSLSWLNIRGLVTLADGFGAFDDTPAETRANLAPLQSVVYWDTGGDEPTFESFLRIEG